MIKRNKRIKSTKMAENPAQFLMLPNGGMMDTEAEKYRDALAE
jgi:hypothetical protein